MRYGALLMAALATLVSLLVFAAGGQLVIPHGQPGRAPVAWGASALWQGREQAWFYIHSMADLDHGTGTLQRAAMDGYTPGASVAQWDAAEQLAHTDPQRRHIFTRDAGPGMVSATVAFEWPLMSAALRELFGTDGLGEARTEYLRGTRAREIGHEQGVFRQRAAVLGDIVRSVPLIVGAPSTGPSEGQRRFAEQFKQRALTVYAGANDGMLHAFSAATGDELFAYVPQALQPGLAALTDPAYRPRAWVDGSASEGEVEMAGRWRTVLASGMGMGARGLFLLDITDPANFGQGDGAYWEFTERDDPAMGHVHAPPILARLPAGEESGAWANRRVAIVANGINPADSGAGALFLLTLDKPASRPWEQGANYFRIPAGARGGMLSPPAVALGPDGEALHAYAGDLAGNLWRFDLRTRVSQRVFTARDARGTPQPIAHAPHIVHGPGGGYLVIFGTGKLLEEADLLPASFSTQSLYGIHDLPGSDAGPVHSRAELAERTLAGEGSYEITGEVLDYFVPHAKRGWFFDLPRGPRDGERAAASPVSQDGVVVFQTVAPGQPGSVTATGAMAGRIYLVGALSGMAVDPLAGARRDARTGALSAASSLQPLILIKGAAQPGPRNPTGGITVVRKLTLLTRDSSGPGPPLDIEVRRRAGRMGWREINNWQDLREWALAHGD